jgi:hypothetical protein
MSRLERNIDRNLLGSPCHRLRLHGDHAAVRDRYEDAAVGVNLYLAGRDQTRHAHPSRRLTRPYGTSVLRVTIMIPGYPNEGFAARPLDAKNALAGKTSGRQLAAQGDRLIEPHMFISSGFGVRQTRQQG